MPSYVSAAGGFSFHLTMRFRMFFSLKPVLERFPFSRLFRGLFSLEDRRKCSRVPLASFVVNALKAFSFNPRKKTYPNLKSILCGDHPFRHFGASLYVLREQKGKVPASIRF